VIQVACMALVMTVYMQVMAPQFEAQALGSEVGGGSAGGEGE
jgi:hypothetical protein